MQKVRGSNPLSLDPRGLHVSVRPIFTFGSDIRWRGAVLAVAGSGSGVLRAPVSVWRGLRGGCGHARAARRSWSGRWRAAGRLSRRRGGCVWTIPDAGTASTNGRTRGPPRAARPPQRPDQPRPVRTRKPQGTPPPAPTRKPRTSRTRGARRDAHTRNHLRKPIVEARAIQK